MSVNRNVEALCPVCGGDAVFFDQAVVLQGFDARFYWCSEDCCIFTPEPSWLDRSYEGALSMSDVGAVARSKDLSELTGILLSTLFKKNLRCLDYGAGYGLFVRMMRDLGYDFSYWDPIGPNIFANGFSLESPTDETFSCVTAFEVIEHLLAPVSDLAAVTAASDLVVLSTSIVPDSLPRLDEWWYYSLETGQHVTLWRPAGIKRLAKELGFHSISIGSLHVFSRRRLPRILVHLLVSTRTRLFTRVFLSRSSLIARDYEHVSGKPWSG